MAQLDSATLATATVAQHLSDHNQLHAKANYVFDVTDYGAVGDGATDDITAITAAITAAEAASPVGTVYFPAKSFYHTTSITAATCSIDSEAGAELTTDQEITALILGESGSSTTSSDRRYVLPLVTQSSINWTATGGGAPMTGTLGTDIGVLVRTGSDGFFQFSTIRDFSFGIKFAPGRDFSYNTIVLPNLANCAVGITIDPATTGWVNQNVFMGGRSGINTVAFPPVTNTRGILVTGTSGGTSAPNGNTFIGTAFEAAGLEYSIRTEWSERNHFLNVRTEGSATVDLNQINSTHFTRRTTVDISDIPATVTQSANSVQNYVGEQGTFLNAQSGSVVYGVSNFSSGNNPVWAAYDASIPPVVPANIDKWTAALGAVWLWGKQSGDATSVSRIKLNMQTGVIYLGTGLIQVQTGSSTPEAAITAPIGSLFLRSDGGANTTLYIKESGAGNTGWVAK